MPTENTSGYRTFRNTSGAAIPAYRRVGLHTDGTIVIVGTAARGIGLTTEVIPNGAVGTVKLWSAPGTFLCTAAGSIGSAGTALIAGAEGQVTTGTGTSLPLVNLTTATAAGDVIECIFTPQ